MKKIKGLNYLVILLFFINLIWFIQNFTFSIKILNDETLKKTFENVAFKHYSFLVYEFFSFIFLIGLFYVQRGLFCIIKKGYFNSTSNSFFRKGGLFFIISGVFNFIMNIIPLLKGSNIFDMFFGNGLLVVIIGLGLYSIAEIFKEGILLKEENDLTV